MRLSWIDYAKVICIYLMVVCHAGLKGMGDNFIYQFHIPAFFIISGYLFRPKGIKKELLSFGVPILFFGIVTLTYRYTRLFVASGFNLSDALGGGKIITLSVLRSFYIASTPSLFQGCWFVLVLWMMRLLMEVGFFRKIKYWLAGFCLLYCCIEPFLQIHSVMLELRLYHLLSSLPFFITGMTIKERNLNVMRGGFETKLILLFLFFGLTLFQGRVDLYKYHYGISYLVFYLNAIIGSYLLVNVCNILPEKEWIKTLSTGTLLILGLHGILFHVINDVLEYTGHTNVYYSVFVGLTVMIICYYPIRCLDKKCPLLLGKMH